jgi:tripartite-type tricarboxylate transporter receptor subunit TctC
MMIAAAGLLATGLAATPAADAADKFPVRPITLIMPFTPGGPTDVHIRSLATASESIFGVPVVVDNKPGAGGTLGPATMAATARPDGYTISNFSTGLYTVPAMQKVQFDTLRDFTYIIQLAGFRLILVVRADSPWKTWKELVADARANPNSITYGSSGIGGGSHLTIASIALAQGIQLRHIPFRGGSEFLAAVLGDHVKLAPPAPGSAREHIEAGSLRPLLSVTPRRSTYFPDIPALPDEGIVTEIDLSGPFGIGGPKGMAPEIVRILHDGFRRAMDAPGYLQAMQQLDMEPAYLNSADYAVQAAKQTVAYRKLIAALGLARPE